MLNSGCHQHVSMQAELTAG